MSKVMDALEYIKQRIAWCPEHEKCPSCRDTESNLAILRDYITTTEAVLKPCEVCDGDGIERCDNPDHGFIRGVGGEINRLGCPCCGHDEDHRIVGNKCPECNGTGYSIPARIKELEEELSREWISTKDRLPEDGQIVAFVIDPSIDHYGDSVCAGNFRIEKYGDRAHPGFNTWGLSGFSASHWMPLPTRPQAALSGARKVGA